jgi:hypothetical protein
LDLDIGESSSQVRWVLKNNIDLEPPEKISWLQPKIRCKPWIVDDNHALEKYGNNKILTREVFEWNSDDDSILDTNDECGRCCGKLQLLGFHPYKDTTFFMVDSFVVVIYHLVCSKFQYIGHLHPKYDKMILEVAELFLYTPGMTGYLPETAKKFEN